MLLQCGELGLLGIDVPERVGGAGLDKVASLVATEAVGACPSFAAAFGAQTGLALIPILCFGTPEQEQRYLPTIVSGETVGAYCLSESASGSDALGARTLATRQPDGSWRLNGEKLWVTNGGFADVFIVFAKVDGEHFSAFIVERGFAGVTGGPEEHKMGLVGSSTTSLVLADAEVPADNLLGEIGKGHRIAFNVLNYGRFKLAAMCTGGARPAIAEAADYAMTRHQFGQPIGAFGAIRHKLAEMAVRLYAVESMLYRTAGLIDEAIADKDDSRGVAKALEEFALEASLLKVAGSEMLDFVLDENVQIHGGNGFVHDYPAERRYRDGRVNRIFEGTNEINRLLVPSLLLKRASAGALPLFEALERAASPDAVVPAVEGPLADERRTADAIRRATLVTMGAAVRGLGDTLVKEQEVVMLLADLVIATFATESVVLRATAAVQSGHPTAGLHADAAAVGVHDAAHAVLATARTAMASSLEGEALLTSATILNRILSPPLVNTVAPRRRIAAAITERRRYPFG
jgi:alkylation response protein AidB-like acyl-CoA dehydrogenase